MSSKNNINNKAKPFQKPKSIIDYINEQQHDYFVTSKLDVPSRNSIYIGFALETCNKDLYQDEYNQYPKYVKPEDIKNIFYEKDFLMFKLVPIKNDSQIETIVKEKNMQDLFKDTDPIVKYKDFKDIFIRGRKYVLICMNLYTNLDLYTYIWRPGFDLDEEFICNITYRSLEILKELKEREIVHNDIKFENMIVTNENPLEISLTDFESADTLDTFGHSSSRDGTMTYMAPEVLRCEEHDSSADVWSLGVNIYYALYYKYPFGIQNNNANVDDEFEILRKIENNELECGDMSGVSLLAWECVEKMLKINPNERITPEEAMNLEWFRKIASFEVKKDKSSSIIFKNFDTEISD